MPRTQKQFYHKLKTLEVDLRLNISVYHCHNAFEPEMVKNAGKTLTSFFISFPMYLSSTDKITDLVATNSR